MNDKILKLPDLTLFTVSAIVLLDTLAASASIGASSLTWWLLLGVIFMLPIGLITSELGTTYPAEGGISVWIKQAFGQKWATRAMWAYWINVAIWLPAIFILFAGVFARLFHLDINITQQIIIGIVLTWMSVAVDVFGLKIGKWVPNLGAVLKMVIFGVLILGGFYYAKQNGYANEINAVTLRPEWKDGLKFLPAIIYGMLGFELVSSAGGQIQEPARNVPRAVVLSGVLILGLYFFSNLGILAAIPAGDIDIVDGLIDTLDLFFASTPSGGAIVLLLGIGALYTFWSNGVTWAMGSNRSIAEAASEGQLPAMFAKTHAVHGGPVGAAVLMGFVCTIALVLYGALVSTNEDLFWALFSFSAVIFMLPYIGMVLAFLKLRKIDPDTPRPFRVPGGIWIARILTAVCFLILVMTVFLFLYVPEEGLQKSTLYGVVVVLLMGEGLIFVSQRNRPKL
ncbi:MAG: APC family permease [Litorimonas sp.]